MIHGDTIDIILGYTVDGSPITEGQFNEIEFTIAARRYTLTGGGVEWDSGESAYVVHLSQAATFSMPTIVPYQTRFKLGEEVVGTKKAYLNLDDTLSKVVL